MSDTDGRIKMTIRNLEGKLRPTIRGALTKYICDLGDTGLFGATPGEVARTLIQESICRHIEGGLIKARRFTTTPE